MTARAAVSLGNLVAALLVGACTSFYEIPIETPIQPKLDISAFQRVLVAGFVAGGTEEVDANLETVRLLRSQLRSRSDLRVIEADVIPLTEVASEQPKAQDSEPPRVLENGTDKGIKDEKDLEAYDHLFANANFWKKLGEEYQNPLIVTGTILFVPHSRSGFVQRDREVVDAYGRRSVQPVRTYMERKGYILRPKFIFIDGRTGTPLYSETFREEVLYNPSQDTPALSSYFELMDRLIPGFLGTLSSQKIKGSRVLLK
ncbi:MAG: hypothetical protein EHM24_13730 [Acidobacteria bacterium]|nr:MAG: hypothetical protein EHM24_13730 [Acidobacteriota bacterium]